MIRLISWMYPAHHAKPGGDRSLPGIFRFGEFFYFDAAPAFRPMCSTRFFRISVKM